MSRNYPKKALVFILASFTCFVYAEEQKISFHLDCVQDSSECVEFQSINERERPIFAMREPEITVGPDEISEAELVPDEFGTEQLHLTFNEGAAEEFAKVTEENVGRVLAIIVNGKVIIAPRIQQSITDGRVVISSGLDRGNTYLDELPWIEKMAEEKEASRETWSLFSVLAFIGLGILVICGSIYFAFLRKQVTV